MSPSSNSEYERRLSAYEQQVSVMLEQVKSLEEAIEWVKRCPSPHPNNETDVEIRPLFEDSDFCGG